MNNSPTTSEPGRRPTVEQRPARRWVLVAGLVACIVAVGILVVVSHRKSQEKGGDPARNTDTKVTNDSTLMASEPTASGPTTELATNATTVPINSERAAVARELVNRLSEIEMQPGGVTSESAAKWNRDLESLVEQGTAAVAPLDEFFQSKVDVRFDTGATNLLGEPSLRMAFIEVLFNIPTPDNVDLQERILRETSDPAEVALLGRQLEAQEPGKYKALIVYAAQAALDQANHGQWPGRDTKPLLRILNNYGAIRK